MRYVTQTFTIDDSSCHSYHKSMSRINAQNVPECLFSVCENQSFLLDVSVRNQLSAIENFSRGNLSNLQLSRTCGLKQRCNSLIVQFVVSCFVQPQQMPQRSFTLLSGSSHIFFVVYRYGIPPYNISSSIRGTTPFYAKVVISLLEFDVNIRGNKLKNTFILIAKLLYLL